MLDPELLRWLRDTPGAKVTLTWKNGNYWCTGSLEERPHVEVVVAAGEASTAGIASEIVAAQCVRYSQKNSVAPPEATE